MSVPLGVPDYDYSAARQTSKMSSFSQSSISMAMASGPPPERDRPGMRRKSSAQNLLSSFKSNNTSQPQGQTTSGGSISSPPGIPAYASAGIPTPTATVFNPGSFVSREDAQSLHSDSTLVNGAGPALSTGTSVEYLRDLVQKRIITLTYMRNVHEGRVFQEYACTLKCTNEGLQPKSLVPYHNDDKSRPRSSL